MNLNQSIVYSGEISENLFSKIFSFCQKAEVEIKHNASRNMDTRNWHTNTSSLLYLLMIEKRFAKGLGGLVIVEQNNEIIACSGFYRSDFNPNVYFIGVRSWVLKNYRFNLIIAEVCLPAQIRICTQYGAKVIAISFNEQTRPFVKLIERANSTTQTTKFFFGDNYPDIYKEMLSVPFPIKLKGVKQWILFKNLEPYFVNWDSLKWLE